MPEHSQRDESARARINGETAKIGWRELQRFFAQGCAISVDPELDLVDVALEMSKDNASMVADWTQSAQVGPVTDSQALEWYEANALMWSVVVRPWVLVQPVRAERPEKSNGNQ